MRPRSFGENLNEWFRVIAATWRPLLILCAVLYVPLGIVTAIMFLVSGAHEQYLDLLVAEDQVQSLEEMLELIGSLIWVGSIWAVLQVLATILVSIAAGRVLALRANDRTSSTAELLGFASRRLASGVGAGIALLVGFVVIVAIAALVGWASISGSEVDFLAIFLTTVVALTALVVTIWLTVGFSLYPISLAMEDVGPMGALASSFRLVRSRWWPTLGFLLLTGLIVSVASQLASTAMIPVFFLSLVEPGFLAFGYGLITMLQGPVVAATGLAYAVWYVDLRGRVDPELSGEALV